LNLLLWIDLDCG